MLPNNIVFQEYSDIKCQNTLETQYCWEAYFLFPPQYIKNAFIKLALSHGKFTLKERILPQNVCCYK